MRAECLRRIDEQICSRGMAPQATMTTGIDGLCATVFAADDRHIQKKLNRSPKVSRSNSSSCAARSPFRSGDTPARSAHCRRAWSSDRDSSSCDKSGCGAACGE